jgi:hypothetical protein
MEGVLSKWTNYVYRWKPRYFVLTKEVIRYYNSKGGKLKGTIHLNLIKVMSHKTKPNQFLLDTGLTILHLKGSSVEEANAWIDSINIAKQ